MGIMEKSKRGSLQIIGSILQSVMANPLRKTHITFKCNLDSRTITKYLKLMRDTGLITTNTENEQFFQITPKGIIYLKHYQSFIELLGDQTPQTIFKNEINGLVLH
jgi:predicted transcriptional regulator